MLQNDQLTLARFSFQDTLLTCVSIRISLCGLKYDGYILDLTATVLIQNGSLSPRYQQGISENINECIHEQLDLCKKSEPATLMTTTAFPR